MDQISPNDLHLRPFQEADRDALWQLKLSPGQENWTHHPRETLPEIEGDPLRRAITILLKGVPVGLFILSQDERVESYAGHPDPRAVTLNALCLDESFQGQGIGTQAMSQLPELVPTLFGQAQRVLLCVHQTNPRARYVYEKTGFRVLRERQGKRGALWVMVREWAPQTTPPN